MPGPTRAMTREAGHYRCQTTGGVSGQISSRPSLAEYKVVGPDELHPKGLLMDIVKVLMMAV